MQKRKLGWPEVLIILIGLALVVTWTIHDWKKTNRNTELFKSSELQAEMLEPLVRSFYQAQGRMPWSLVDRLPSGQRFVDLLPNGQCFANTFTGQYTEPRFFDRIHKEADAGTVAVIKEEDYGYIVVYGVNRQAVVLKLRL
jgi:hypothetical protein